jgi:hypothetical protein
MREEFKKYFVAIWIISILFFSLQPVFGFANNLIIKSVNYLYVFSLIFLFIESDFLTERTLISEKFVNLKGYDIWGLLFVIVGATVLLLFIGLKSSVILIMAIVTFAISVWIILKYRNLLTKSLITKGLIIGSLSAVAQYNFFPSLLAIFILVPFFYVAASLLNNKYKFTIIHFNNNSYRNLIKSFLIGCLLSMPMALSNLSDVMTTNPYNWINHFWKPVLAFNFVLLEETWVRLFIVTFIFVLLISKTDKKFISIAIAIMISSTIFGLTHYPNVTIPNCINIAILYGLPLGVLLYKRDFETAVGYHFMINFVSAVSTYAISN